MNTARRQNWQQRQQARTCKAIVISNMNCKNRLVTALPCPLIGSVVLLARRHDAVHQRRKAVDDIDRIVLYRQPILFYWGEYDETLEAIVRHVIIHEIGHHFGLSDDGYLVSLPGKWKTSPRV